MNSNEGVDGSSYANHSFVTSPQTQLNPSIDSPFPSTEPPEATNIQTDIHTFFESYSLLPADLISMATELDSLLEGSSGTQETRRALKEESWRLQGILNRVAFNRTVIQTCAQQLVQHFQSYQNRDVELVMKNYVAKRLIIKGKESSESMVCMSFSFLLAELASLDSLFVNMIMGQLYKQCPLIRLETSQLDSLSAEEFESIVMKDSMMIRLFAGLFLFNPRLFPIEFAWKWINLVVQLADCTHFLEASHSLEAFLETCGFVLQKEKPRFSNLLKHINEITIPNLSDLPSFTSGSIARLKILVSKQYTFADLYLSNLSRVCVYKHSIHCTNREVLVL